MILMDLLFPGLIALQFAGIVISGAVIFRRSWE